MRKSRPYESAHVIKAGREKRHSKSLCASTRSGRRPGAMENTGRAKGPDPHGMPNRCFLSLWAFGPTAVKAAVFHLPLHKNLRRPVGARVSVRSLCSCGTTAISLWLCSCGTTAISLWLCSFGTTAGKDRSGAGKTPTPTVCGCWRLPRPACRGCLRRRRRDRRRSHALSAFGWRACRSPDQGQNGTCYAANAQPGKSSTRIRPKQNRRTSAPETRCARPAV